MQIILNFKKHHFLMMGLIIAIPFLFITITNIFASGALKQYTPLNEITTDAAGFNIIDNGSGYIRAEVIDGSIGGGIPSGFCIFSDTQTTCSDGWTRRTQFDGKTIRGAVTPGGTGGANTHNHAMYIDGDKGGSYWQESHANVGASNWPPYTEVLICCKD